MEATKPKGKLPVSAAKAVNQLLGYLGILSPAERAGDALIGREAPPATRARDAAALLADLAHNQLHAGRSGDDVRQAWPQLALTLEAMQPGVCGARHPSRPEVRCLQQMTEHEPTWHEAPGPCDDTRTSSIVWAVDAVRDRRAPKQDGDAG